MRLRAGFILMGLFFSTASLRADGLPIEQWRRTFDQPETQRAILAVVSPYPLQDGTPLLDPSEKTYAFPSGPGFVQLSKSHPGLSSADGTKSLIVTCWARHALTQAPLTAVTYVLTPTGQSSITDGQATQEKAGIVEMPSSHKAFLAITRFTQVHEKLSLSVLLFDFSAGVPRSVWISNWRWRVFDWGFANIDGNAGEELIVRAAGGKGPAGKDLYNGFDLYDSFRTDSTTQYAAYRWTGSTFDPMDIPSESEIKSLPESIWQHHAQ